MRYRQSCWLGGCLSQPRNQPRRRPVTEPLLVASHPCQRRWQCHDEPRVPLLVLLQVCGQRMTVWALQMGGGLDAGSAPRCCTPSKKWGSAPTVARTRPLVHYAASNAHWRHLGFRAQSGSTRAAPARRRRRDARSVAQSGCQYRLRIAWRSADIVCQPASYPSNSCSTLRISLEPVAVRWWCPRRNRSTFWGWSAR